MDDKDLKDVKINNTKNNDDDRDGRPDPFIPKGGVTKGDDQYLVDPNVGNPIGNNGK